MNARVEAALSGSRGASALLGGALAIAGLAAFALGLGLGQARLAFAVLDASWLFFAGLAAGCLALAAVVRLSGGRWAGAALPIAEATGSFLAPALGLQIVLVLGAGALVPAAGSRSGLLGLALRQILPTLVLLALGRRLVGLARATGPDAGPGLSSAVAYLLAYAIALSLWAFDWVMELTRAPPAAVVPAYYFMGAFLSAIAWVSLVAAMGEVSGSDLRHDLGKLLFAFSVVWAYLLWALYLAAWYGNLPGETGPLLRRWQGPWRPASAAVVGAVFLWPFGLLLSEKAKRWKATLALGAGVVLLGLWVERFLLVLPSFDWEGGGLTLLVGAGTAAGVAGLFLLRVGPELEALAAQRAPAMRL